MGELYSHLNSCISTTLLKAQGLQSGKVAAPEVSFMAINELDRITTLLTDFLDIQSRRAELVASNLANADTPDFKAKELDFEEYLRAAARHAVAPKSANVAA